MKKTVYFAGFKSGHARLYELEVYDTPKRKTYEVVSAKTLIGWLNFWRKRVNKRDAGLFETWADAVEYLILNYNTYYKPMGCTSLQQVLEEREDHE